MPKGTEMLRIYALSVVSLFLVLAGVASAQRPESGKVVVHRDEFGVPYIVAGNDNDAAFGLGYAMAEDRLEDLHKNIRTAIGLTAGARRSARSTKTAAARTEIQRTAWCSSPHAPIAKR